jgi:hypothetical protein
MDWAAKPIKIINYTQLAYPLQPSTSLGVWTVKKNVARVRRNESEEIRLSLEEANGELHVELRVYSRSKGQGGAYLPEPEAVIVPTRALADLCRALEETNDSLREGGIVESPPLSNLITGDAGSSSIELGEAFTPVPETRSENHVAVKLPFDSYLLGGAPETWPAQPLPDHVEGDMRILSGTGALAWFSVQIAVSSRLAIVLRIGDLNFRGQAEVVEVAPDPKDGKYWHRLEWLSPTPQAQETLSKIIDTATQNTGDPA